MSSHDCVIIPNFGAFIAEYCAPEVEEDKSTLPRKDILFNRSLTRNDGLLINALIEEKGIGYDAAKMEIEQYVLQIKSSLHDGEAIVIDDIGEMSLDESGFIRFVENEHNSCLLDAYGLPPVRLKKIFRKKPQETASDKEEVSDQKHRVLLRVATAAAVVAFILIFATPLTDRTHSDYASLGFDSYVPHVVAEDSVVSDSSSTVYSQVAKNDSVITPQLPHAYYHIIIASLPTESLADKYIQSFKYKNDFDTLSVIRGAGRCRISLAHFETKDDAVAFVKTLRSEKPDLSDSWVLSQALN